MKLADVMPQIFGKKRPHNAVGTTRPKKVMHGIGTGMGYWLNPPPLNNDSLSGDGGGDGGGGD